MDAFSALGTLAILVWIVVPCLVLLLLYGVIRVAVARGLRDHQRWMEKHRPQAGQAIARRESIGQYLGLAGAATEPRASDD